MPSLLWGMAGSRYILRCYWRWSWGGRVGGRCN
jgi:hypothetical protein